MKNRAPNGHWNIKNNCMKDAMAFNSITEWARCSGGAYESALRHGWVADCTKHFPIKKRGKWTLEECVLQAKKAHTRSEWEQLSVTSYNAARRNGWMDICCQHMVSKRYLNGRWTKARCLLSARDHNVLSNWREADIAAYNNAHRLGCFKDCIRHMTRTNNFPGYWTKDRLISDGKKYNTKSEWLKNSSAAYQTARRSDFFSECTSHMVPFRKAPKWTKETCMKDASRYSTISAWRHAENSGYHSAKKMKCIKECTSHMKKSGGTSFMEQNLREAISSKYPEASPERFTVRESGIEAKSLEIDIFVKSVNKGIEFNGRYWHSPEQLRKRFPKWTQESVDRYHEIKQEYFRSIGIEILFIEEKEWRTNKEEQIQKALSFLAVTNG